MTESYLFDPVQILQGSNTPLIKDAVLINNGKIKAFGEQARKEGKALGAITKSSPHQLIAPCLVDPHSILEETLNGRSETLVSIREKAALAGYGQLALLPRRPTFRDRADRLRGFSNSNNDVVVFSCVRPIQNHPAERALQQRQDSFRPRGHTVFRWACRPPISP